MDHGSRFFFFFLRKVRAAKTDPFPNDMHDDVSKSSKVLQVGSVF